VDPSRLVLLPLDPDASARSLRAALRDRHGVDVAVIVTDTMGRPWRYGLMDLAIGAAGIAPLRDHRGETDAYGNELHLTQMAVIDELASAAELVKGKRDQIPVAVVRGYPLSVPGGAPHGPGAAAQVRAADDGPGAAALVRAADQDLFPLGSAEARVEGLWAAARLDTAATGAGVGPEAADPVAVARAVADVAGALAPGTSLTHFTDPLVRDKLAALVGGAARGGPVELVLCAAADPVTLGVDVHRLRCALAAENLVSGWRAVTAERLSSVGAPAPSGGALPLVLVWAGRA
jgi:coenzyme F420-0:L-glutamate ligase/coenzyme F420-1:gamma-L-glutamate ligase